MLVDYTAPQPDANVKTILDGIRGKLPAANIEYVKGCAIRDTTTENICEAVEAARRADVVVVAVGGSSARDFKTTYQETGAAVADKATISDMECGEGFDRASLKLLGLQNRLLRAVKKTGKPMVVVYVEGRPLDKLWAAEHADALLTAYYPGQEGGEAIADVLFGDYNPAGRLPVSVPRSVGQLPVYYNRKRPAAHDYVELSARPLYPFGYGLSYTSFAYTDLRVNQKSLTDYDVTLNVRNIGDRDGDEVVQLYVSDLVASVVQPIKQLRRFKRVTIRKGETVHLSFTLTADDFALIDRDMKHVVESGDFEIQIGSSSDDIRLRTNLTIK